MLKRRSKGGHLYTCLKAEARKARSTSLNVSGRILKNPHQSTAGATASKEKIRKRSTKAEAMV